MTLARTFPIRPAPLPREALDSWLEALAHQLNVRLGDVLDEELLDRVKNDAASEKARKELEVALAARRITTKPLRRAG
jgi:TniQ